MRSTSLGSAWQEQQIATLENPDRNPTLATLDKVATALGMRVELAMTAE